MEISRVFATYIVMFCQHSLPIVQKSTTTIEGKLTASPMEGSSKT